MAKSKIIKIARKVTIIKFVLDQAYMNIWYSFMKYLSKLQEGDSGENIQKIMFRTQ